MAALKVLASVSLVALAIATRPALASNDGQSSTPPSGPSAGPPSAASPDGAARHMRHAKLSPEQRAARKARREARRAARLRNQPGTPSVTGPN